MRSKKPINQTRPDSCVSYRNHLKRFEIINEKGRSVVKAGEGG